MRRQAAAAQSASIPASSTCASSSLSTSRKLHINVDRTKAQQAGFTPARRCQQPADLAQRQLPDFADLLARIPRIGVSYPIATQTPQYRMDSLQATRQHSGDRRERSEARRFWARWRRSSGAAGQALVSHYDIQPVIDIYGTVQRRDLGGVADDVKRIVDDSRKELPRGSSIVVRGQVQTMQSSFTGCWSGWCSPSCWSTC